MQRAITWVTDGKAVIVREPNAKVVAQHARGIGIEVHGSENGRNKRQNDQEQKESIVTTGVRQGHKMWGRAMRHAGD